MTSTPLRVLHPLQSGRRLLRILAPPLATGRIWSSSSAVVAPQRAHSLPKSTMSALTCFGERTTPDALMRTVRLRCATSFLARALSISRCRRSLMDAFRFSGLFLDHEAALVLFHSGLSLVQRESLARLHSRHDPHFPSRCALSRLNASSDKAQRQTLHVFILIHLHQPALWSDLCMP